MSRKKRNYFYGNVPDNWNILPLKYVCLKSSIYGANISANNYITEGIRFIRTSDIKENGKLIKEGVYLEQKLVNDYLLNVGDLLISRSGTLGRAYIYDTNDGDCSYAGYLVRYILNNKINPFFAFYLTKTFYFENWLRSSVIEATIGNINGEKYANMLIPLPNIEKQNHIVYFLKLKLEKIDQLIEKKEQLIQLLSEKRQAIITQAVTRGIDPKTKLKASGIDWLGEIPEHWEIEKTRWLFKERNERSQTGEEDLLTVSHITGVTLRSEKDVNMFEAESNEGYKIAKEGDLVINTLWAWMGAMGISKKYGIVSPAYHVYEPLNRLNPNYIDSIVRLPIFANEVTRYSKGVWSSRLRLYPEGLYEVYFPVPSLEEQNQIVDYLKKELSKIDKITSVTKKSIELLKERRSALISVTVTGQIEIPEIS